MQKPFTYPASWVNFLMILLFAMVSPAISQHNDLPQLIQLNSARSIEPVTLPIEEMFISGISIDSVVMSGVYEEVIRKFLIPGSGIVPDTITINRVMKHNVGYSIIGSINGSAYDSFTMSYDNGLYLSRINKPGTHEVRHIRYVDEYQSHVLLEIDPGLMDFLSCTIDDHDHFKRSDNQHPQKEKSFIPPDYSQSDSEIDVMIVYTPAAASWASENASGIQNVINQSMAIAQNSFDNSDVAIKLNLVHTFQVNYEESGDSGDDLENLTFGEIANVHALRNQYGADLVAMFTRVQDTGGIAWYLNNTSGDVDYAYSITRVQQAGWTNTHAHEMAHNMGSAHSRNQARAPAGSGLLFNYSTGWRWTGIDGKVYISVMTYSNNDDADPGTSIDFFSNPNINYQGVPTGSYTGQYAPADNARSLNDMREVIANYKPSGGIGIQEPEGTLCEAVENCDLDFVTGGNADWFGQSQVVYMGSTAAASGFVTHNQSSWVETTVMGPGDLSFFWKVSSEQNWDYLNFSVNGTKISGISGEVDWTQIFHTIPEGDHTVRWSYDKDESVNDGADRGWLDAVVFEQENQTLPMAPAPVINPEPGLYEGSVEVIITTTTPGAAIYYTLDESNPTTNSNLYTTFFTLHPPSTVTVKAIVTADGYENSEITTSTFTLIEPEFPSSFIAELPTEEIEILLDPEAEFEFTTEWNAVPAAETYAMVGMVERIDDEASGKLLAEHEISNQFNEPDFIILSDSDGTLPKITLDYEKMDKALFDADVRPGETINLQWTIRATNDGQNIFATTSSVFKIKRHESAPDPVSIELTSEETPSRYELDQNYPNPFNPTTTIRFLLPESEYVTVEVYAITGQVISTLVNEVRPAGWHSVNFDASELSSSVYLYRLITPSQVITKKMLLMK